jgi:hypothetical protein
MVVCANVEIEQHNIGSSLHLYIIRQCTLNINSLKHYLTSDVSSSGHVDSDKGRLRGYLLPHSSFFCYSMAYQYSGYEGNCSLSLQNCATLYPKTSSLAYGPRFTTESCVPYPFYPTGDVGVCGWKGAPCAADAIERTNCSQFPIYQ